MQKEKGATIQTFSITDMLQANKKKEKKKQVGEYIDYEEIE